LRADLQQAFDTPKCQKCGCLRDTLFALREETAAVTGEEAEDLRTDITLFLEGMEPIQYACLGCDPCYPAVAENHFHAAAEGVLPLREVHRPSCAWEVRADGAWPLVPGEYVVVDRAAAVAVSTLASTDLPPRLAALRPPGLAIVGKTETENIGLDKVVKNVVANPHIRVLLVAGQEPKGHLSGQTLLALAANGVDEKRRVLGSRGKRPFLRNVTPEEVEQFRRQVEVVDLIGSEEAEGIAREVEVRDVGRGTWDAGCGLCSVSCPSSLVPRPTSPVPHIRAVPPTRVKLDKAGYFVILPQPDRNVIVCEHYAYDDTLQHVIEGEDARAVCATIVERGWVTQLDHAAYLGRELAKAEESLRSGRPYVQDGAV